MLLIMGSLLSSCIECFGTKDDDNSPSYEERRQQMLEAAERRQKAEESRGITDIRSVKLKQERSEAIENASYNQQPDGPLRWQVS